MPITEASYTALPLRDELRPWFGGYEDDYDLDGICREYAATLEARLEGMPGFTALSWPADSSPMLWVDAYATPEQIDAIRYAIDRARRPAWGGGVDLESIARRHELTEAGGRWPHPAIVWTGIILFCAIVWGIAMASLIKLIGMYPTG